MKNKITVLMTLGAAAMLLSNGGARGASNGETWNTANGNQQAQKYSTATEITPANVKNLRQVWSLHTGDVGTAANRSGWGATPLFVNDTLYVGTPKFRIFAVAPDTGTVKWIYDAKLHDHTDDQELLNRGIAYWQSAAPMRGQRCEKIIYLGTMAGNLHAVDADTGQLCTGFADGGVLNVNQWNTVNAKWKFALPTPPTVYKDTLILGWTGLDGYDKTESPGTVFGLDARTGRLKWTFHPIPKEMENRTGTANVWGAMSVDPETGMVYLPVSSPSPNFYGGDRLTEMPLVTSVTALKAETGELVWSRQLVHHDIWDFDTNSAPVLLSIRKDGQLIPALVQATKQGMLFVLNRMTGDPVFPIEERPVPVSDVPGEKAAPTQPYVPLPEPTGPERYPGISLLADIASFGQCSRMAARLKYDGRFTTPSLRGSLEFPATTGGVEWGGGAADPTTNTYVVNSSNVVEIDTLIKRADADQLLQGNLRIINSTATTFAEQGSPYAFKLDSFFNFLRMPCWNPPYGTLSSYDMNTGRLLWRKPFGQVQKWGFYMPESWGSVTIGGPVITKTGIIFIGASMDSRVRAIDLKTGDVLWKALVEAPATATAAVYTYKGKEYVAFAAGGNVNLMHRSSDQLVAFAL